MGLGTTVLQDSPQRRLHPAQALESLPGLWRKHQPFEVPNQCEPLSWRGGSQNPCLRKSKSALERNTIISAIIIMAPPKVTSVELRDQHTPLSPYHLHPSRAAPRETSLNPHFTGKETEAQNEKRLSPHSQEEVEAEFKPRRRSAGGGSTQASQQVERPLNPASSSLSEACAPAPLTQSLPHPSAPPGSGA